MRGSVVRGSAVCWCGTDVRGSEGAVVCWGVSRLLVVGSFGASWDDFRPSGLLSASVCLLSGSVGLLLSRSGLPFSFAGSPFVGSCVDRVESGDVFGSRVDGCAESASLDTSGVAGSA